MTSKMDRDSHSSKYLDAKLHYSFVKTKAQRTGAQDDSSLATLRALYEIPFRHPAVSQQTLRLRALASASLE